MSDTHRIAKEVLQHLHSPATLCLQGDLGAGKTTFTQSLARYLDVKENVTSPTFTLLEPYTAYHKKFAALIHIDAYRLSTADELFSLGAHEYFTKPETLTVIEWPENVSSIIPRDAYWLMINFSKKKNERVFTLKEIAHHQTAVKI